MSAVIVLDRVRVSVRFLVCVGIVNEEQGTPKTPNAPKTLKETNKSATTLFGVFDAFGVPVLAGRAQLAGHDTLPGRIR